MQFAASCIDAGLEAVKHFVHGVRNTGSQVVLPSGLAAREKARLDSTEVNGPAYRIGHKGADGFFFTQDRFQLGTQFRLDANGRQGARFHDSKRSTFVMLSPFVPTLTLEGDESGCSDIRAARLCIWPERRSRNRQAECRPPVPVSCSTTSPPWRIATDHATAHIPVIYLTAGAALEERLTGLREGGVDYILKPFEPEEVLVRVAVHLTLARRGAQPPEGVAEVLRRPPASEDEEPHDPDRVIVTAAQRLIESDLANVPPLPALAARVGTHEKRLTRAFRAHTGRTVLEFAREARLLRAQHLLAQTPLGIEELAHAIGFSGAANFTTAFRERFGSTPAAYRRLYRGSVCGA